jgi:hypothetical protein
VHHADTGTPHTHSITLAGCEVDIRSTFEVADKLQIPWRVIAIIKIDNSRPVTDANIAE